MADLEDELTQDMIEFLDKLVATGAYRDRGDALRQVLRSVIDGIEKKKKKEEEPPDTTDTGGEVVIQLKKIPES